MRIGRISGLLQKHFPGSSAAAMTAVTALILACSLVFGCAKAPNVPPKETLPQTSPSPYGTASPGNETGSPSAAETGIPDTARPSSTPGETADAGTTPGGESLSPETPDDSPAGTQNDPTAGPPKPTEQPTESASPAPDPDKDILISGFETVPVFIDWQDSGLDLSNPVMNAAESDFSEDGLCLAVTLSDNAAWQYFIEGVTAWSPVHKYLRLWIVNATGGDLDVGPVLKTSAAAAAFDASKATVRLCDGSAISLDSRDPSGVGNGFPTSLVVPHGFAGWISFPLDSLIAHLSDPFLEGAPSTVSLDVRPSGYVSGGIYYVDGLCLTNKTEGVLRNALEFGESSISANKKFIDGEISAALSGTVAFEIAGSVKDGDCEISGMIIDGYGDDGVSTKFSALFAAPSGGGEGLPAVVLLCDPDSLPSLRWLKNWVGRGYVVIMPDLSGAIPSFEDGGGSSGTISWSRELPEAYSSEGFVLMPSFDRMANSGLPAKMQWTFHALYSAARCSAILRSVDFVDPSKIGIAGIGWGGVVATLCSCWDKNVSFAITMQAAAFLENAAAPVAEAFSGAETRALWSASSRLPEISAPMLLIGGGSQGYFDVSCLSDTYFALTGLGDDNVFAVLDGFEADAGMFTDAPVQFAFADRITAGGGGIPSFVTMPSKGAAVSCDVTGAVSAELCYLTGNYTYGYASEYSGGYPLMRSPWKKAALTLTDGHVYGNVPKDAVIYFVRIADAEGNSVSSFIFD